MPLYALPLVAYSGAFIMYMFDPLRIGGSPDGGFHTYGVMYVAFILYVLLLLCSILCTLPLLDLAHIVYFPFSIGYPSFIFLFLVYF